MLVVGTGLLGGLGLLGCGPAAGGGGAAGGVPPTATLPTPYPPDWPVATVDGQPISMAELDAMARVSLALDRLRGKDVPARGTPEMRAYEADVLERLIDRRLVSGAIERDGVRLPAEIAPVADHIQSYLQRIGASRQQLDAVMAAAGATPEVLETWFKETRTMNFYFLARSGAKDPAATGSTFAEDWLAEAWRTQPIDFDFHGIQPSGAASAGGAPTAEVPPP